jgi:hypothetical protein
MLFAALNSSICKDGWAMNASHGKDEVPAHRVNVNGLLTGNPDLVQTHAAIMQIVVVDIKLSISKTLLTQM